MIIEVIDNNSSGWLLARKYVLPDNTHRIILNKEQGHILSYRDIAYEIIESNGYINLITPTPDETFDPLVLIG